MNKVAQYWPTIRQVVYSLAAAGLAVAAALGYFTDAEVGVWLERVGSWLGIVGLIVATLYVKRGPAEESASPAVQQLDVRAAPGGSGGGGGHGDWTQPPPQDPFIVRR